MNKVVDIKVLEDYYIWLKFNDSEENVINFRPFIGDGFTAELLNYENFKKVSIDAVGGIAWESGFDFCPNYLKQLVEQK